MKTFKILPVREIGFTRKVFRHFYALSVAGVVIHNILLSLNDMGSDLQESGDDFGNLRKFRDMEMVLADEPSPEQEQNRNLIIDEMWAMKHA